MDIINILMQVAVLIFAVIIHEVAHGFVAYKLGDPTAKFAGRLTLNPIPHIDPVWSILIPGFLILSGSSFIIGGAKPVPINPAYFKKHKRDVMIVSASGPASNLLLMLLSVLFLKITLMVPGLRQMMGLNLFLSVSILINFILAIFNLIPVPPLDGSKILMGLLPDEWAYRYERLGMMGLLIVVVLIMTGGLRLILYPFAFALIKFLMLVFGGDVQYVLAVHTLMSWLK